MRDVQHVFMLPHVHLCTACHTWPCVMRGTAEECIAAAAKEHVLSTALVQWLTTAILHMSANVYTLVVVH